VFGTRKSRQSACLVAIVNWTTPAHSKIMIDKIPQITAFLKKHYTPGTIEKHSLKETSSGLLSILFDVFPMDCIDTDDLYNILSAQGYEPQKAKVDEFYWCLLEND